MFRWHPPSSPTLDHGDFAWTLRMAGLMLLRALAGPGGVGVTLFPEQSSSEICPIVDEGSPLVTSGLALSLCLGALMDLGGFTVQR